MKKEELIRAINIIKPGLKKIDGIEFSGYINFYYDELISFDNEILISCPYNSDIDCAVENLQFIK